MMPKIQAIEELKGKKFGKLTTLGFLRVRDRHAEWVCECECGTLVVAKMYALKQGMKISCGCAKGNHKQIHFTPDELRAILALYEDDILTYKQLGDKLGISAPQARRAVMKARELNNHLLA